MSLFNKQKRNIRRRFLNEDEEDNENRSTVPDDIPGLKNRSKKEKPKQTLLSFGEELEEADGGEVFKVKKSSRSRRLAKQLDQERKKKKDEEKMQVEPDSTSIPNMQEKDLEIKTDDLVVKIKNTEPLILHGRDALMAGKDDYTSEDEPPEDDVRHTFQKKSDRSENVKFFLKSGCIPDAAMIHAARKRRQKARELGNDYIPIEEQGDDNKEPRSVREEDHDHSDDDYSQERINMTVDTEALDKERRRQAFLESQASMEKQSDEESEPEEEEWETQQIRKGVTGAQIAAAHLDSFMQFNTLDVGLRQTAELRMPMIMSSMVPAAPPPPIIQPPDPTKFVPVTAEEVLNVMRERLVSLREVHRRHELNYDAVVEELYQSKRELEDGQNRAPEMADRYRYYQELRGYITDLVECLDDKLPLVAALESRWIDLYGDRASELMERRRQDIRDQAEEVTAIARGPIVRRGPEDDARMKRATEREGRRSRRRRMRELAPALPRHMDGMSSDDEVTEQQNLLFKQSKDEIDKASRELFTDVEDDFSTIRGILAKLEDWRKTDLESYNDAYVSLCIPKIISPLVRLQIITWNPIMECVDLERSKWYNSLLLYALNAKETEESLRRDPDVRLVPSAIEKIIILKLTTIVERIWDPMSTSQTLRLVGLTNRLIRDYPNLNETSKQLETLLNAVLNKMQSAVDNDIFIPIFPKQVMDTKHPFFQRQFAMAIKLLRNFLSWQGLIGDHTLRNIALGSLLNRYLLPGLRVSAPVDAVIKANMVMSTLPRAWLQGETIGHLKMFATLIQQLSEQLDQANPAHNEAWEYSKSILKIIRPLSIP